MTRSATGARDACLRRVLVLAMLFISFIFLSIEDIAVQIEEPFAVLPLHDLALELSQRVAAVVDGPAPPDHHL